MESEKTMPLWRKALLLVISVGLIAGGLYWLAVQLFFAPVLYARWLLSGALPVFIGAYLLWEDFIAPLFGIKGKQ
jgi:hypothetical protein